MIETYVLNEYYARINRITVYWVTVIYALFWHCVLFTEVVRVAHGDRHARVTCDLLSVSTKWGSLNHAACAARCIAQRKKGGTCKEGVCHCRDWCYARYYKTIVVIVTWYVDYVYNVILSKIYAKSLCSVFIFYFLYVCEYEL